MSRAPIALDIDHVHEEMVPLPQTVKNFKFNALSKRQMWLHLSTEDRSWPSPM